MFELLWRGGRHQAKGMGMLDFVVCRYEGKTYVFRAGATTCDVDMRNVFLDNIKVHWGAIRDYYLVRNKKILEKNDVPKELQEQLLAEYALDSL